MGPPRRTRQAGMLFIFVTLFIDILGIGIVIPILPELVGHLLPGDAAQTARYYGVIIAVYAFMQFLCAPVLGALSDRFGRRPILLVSIFVLIMQLALTSTVLIYVETCCCRR